MPDDPLIGRQLANFRIERLIGRGGMAQVYYARDVRLHREVAIKVIDARYRDDPMYAQRFLREARALATWRHDNIVQIYYAGEEAGLYYFAMEFIDGPDLGKRLASYIADGERMPYAEVVRIGRGVAAALDYAHARGVVHRDVKPSNVLLTDDGRVVLSDFGLALEVGDGSLGEVFGTSRYIAPEQARRSTDAVPQSDVYALGVIFYEALVGRVPFDDLSPTTVALQHVTQAPPAPRDLNPDLSKSSETVLLKALSKAAEDRYETASELVDALEKALKRSKAPSSTGKKKRRRGRAEEKVIPRKLIGMRLDEYKLEALLGQGSMGRIYRGTDVRLKRQVAIKVIHPPLRADPAYRRRFEREARAIAQLEHPHIVSLYRYGEEQGVMYMAMQFIDGATLQAKLAASKKKRKRMPFDEAARILGQVCQALDYAHSRGVIHRDVKPSNIILDKQGQVILTDFGLALQHGAGTRGEIFGSPHYIAPEQAVSSAKVVPQSDLYAVGVILYEMLTKQVPFDAKDPLDIALMHMSESPRPPSELRNDITPELEEVILKSLAKEPKERYPTGAALVEAYARALKPEPRPAASVRPAPKQTTSKKSTARSLPPIPAAVAASSRKSGVKKAATKPERKRRRWIWLFVPGVLIALIVAGLLFVNSGLLNSATTVDTQVAQVASPLETPGLHPETISRIETATAQALIVADVPSATPSPTASVTSSPTSAPSVTATSPASASVTATVTQTPTSNATSTRTATSVPSATPTPVTPVAAPASRLQVFIPLIIRNFRTE